MILPILYIPCYGEEDAFGLSGRECIVTSQYHFLTSTFTCYTGKKENKTYSSLKNVERLDTVHQDHTYMDLDSEDQRVNITWLKGFHLYCTNMNITRT